jgi:hypothetical protein
MSEAEFVGRIVARLQSAPTLSRNISQLGSNDVPRPAGLPSLGKVLRRHPSLFDVCTSADTVSLVVGAVEAEYVAVAPLKFRDSVELLHQQYLSQQLFYVLHDQLLVQ